ncbi:serine protein kinase RIO [Oerskovia enterophila]|uniref:serine protein kinase RIO n=1 Tax=Oerskovia enterophila TaxID=43678 RepID=UPI003396681F
MHEHTDLPALPRLTGAFDAEAFDAFHDDSSDDAYRRASFPSSVPDDAPDLDPDLDPDQRWSTWSSVEKGMRGPEPRPEWVVTADAAIDTDLGVLKTGKEADVFLLERAVPDEPSQFSLLAAKRYRSSEHRAFHRDSAYVEGRQVRRSRDRRAIERKSSYGREAAAAQWANAEFAALTMLWSAGAPVPYPVQIDGTEILMEFVGEHASTGQVDGSPASRVAAPRLARVRPDAGTLEAYWDQLRGAMGILAAHGYAHGDLSPYNVLAQGERIVIIDLPQVLDLVANPHGTDLLMRDCRTMCAWFRSRGLDVDEGELFAELIARAW